MIRANITGGWLVLLVVATVISGSRVQDHQQRAFRVEFRILYEKIQGNPGRVARNDHIRRESSAIAEDWEHLTISFAIASGIAAVSTMGVGMAMGWTLLVGSVAFVFVGPFIVPTILAKLPGIVEWLIAATQ